MPPEAMARAMASRMAVAFPGAGRLMPTVKVACDTGESNVTSMLSGLSLS
jgi:hypothetical protein